MDDGLDTVFARATTIYERIAWGAKPILDPGSKHRIEMRLKNWQTNTGDGQGDHRALSRRLALSGWRLESLHTLLDRVSVDSAYAIPPWRTALARGLQTARIASFTQTNPGLSRLMWSDLLSPLVDSAIAALPDIAVRRLEPQAMADASHALLRHLAWISTPTLSAEFHAFRAAREPTLARVIRIAKGQNSDTIYRQFILRHSKSGLQYLVNEYPVLARLWGAILNTWTTVIGEFARHLDNDWPELCHHFGLPSESGSVSRLFTELSDRHRGGHTVMLVQFLDGQNIVYKPKPLCSERLWFDLLKWLNEAGAPLHQKPLNMLERSTYGWVQYASHADCKNDIEIREFYRRMGGLLCFLYLLDASDCHHENVVASGAFPVLVDLETLLHPLTFKRRDDSDLGGLEAVYQTFHESVFRTGLLPTWTLDPEGEAYDASGIGGFGEQRSARLSAEWTGANTDNLRLELRTRSVRSGPNVPTLEGNPCSPLTHRQAIMEGFRLVYRWALKNRERLLAGPLSGLPTLRPRVVLRDTAEYARLLRHSIQPCYLRDGADWSIELERLCGRYLMAKDPQLWPVSVAEIEDLVNLDVPYFTTSTISKNICDSRGKIIVKEAFEEVGHDRVLQRFQAMSKTVLEREIKHIEFSFQARSAEGAHHEASSVSKSAVCDVPNNDEFVHEAEKIGAELAREALTTKGETEWIGLQYGREVRRYQYMPLGTDLYSGKGGIAIFLAALWSLTNDRIWRDLALSSVARARQEIAGGGATLDLSTGSLIYILTWLGRCFDDKGLIDDATNLVARLDDEVIDANDQFDVLFGVSGLMLALLALAGTGNEAALSKAVHCGQHLLLGRRPAAGGALAWPRPGHERPLTGFSHGAAGIAYALARLYAATGDSTYLAAAREGIEYERNVFDSQAGNWPDYRDRTRIDGGFMMSWCNGAPGIGLGRIGVKRLCSIAGLDQEITTALRSTFASGLSSIDTVCCGNFGRIELLMSADDQEWQVKAKQLASHAISRARHAGGFCTNIEVPRWARTPGFFQGTSGIGYQLLRLGDPTLPSVLLFETP